MRIGKSGNTRKVVFSGDLGQPGHPIVKDPTPVMQWLQKTGGKPPVTFVQDVEESIALNQVTGGAIIISASGMCDAGRIKYHLKYNLPRPECTILITGFQAAGTLGRRLVDGAKSVKIFGEEIPVRADLYTIGGLSAHADQAGLMGWLEKFHRPPTQTFVVHGEPVSATALADLIRARLRWQVSVPDRQASVAF